MNTSRITIFAGHYGSGKTNLAINYALWLKKTIQKVVICDLDIVNPYFRTADSLDFLNNQGIELITSKYTNSNVDMPAMPAGTQAVFDNKDIYAVIDLGGDDRGALALGRYAKSIMNEGNYEMLLVANQYRPLTRDVETLMEIKDEIENAAHVMFTGIVNNSNLGDETTAQDVMASLSFSDRLSKELKLPVKMTAIHQKVLIAAENERKSLITELDVFPIEIYKKNIWKI